MYQNFQARSRFFRYIVRPKYTEVSCSQCIIEPKKKKNRCFAPVRARRHGHTEDVCLRLLLVNGMGTVLVFARECKKGSVALHHDHDEALPTKSDHASAWSQLTDDQLLLLALQGIK